jgi:hypothetical protein
MRFLLGFFSDNSTSTEVRPEKDPFTKRFDNCIRSTRLLLVDADSNLSRPTPALSGYKSFKQSTHALCGDTLNIDIVVAGFNFIERWDVLATISAIGISAHGLVIVNPDGGYRMAGDHEAVLV